MMSAKNGGGVWTPPPPCQNELMNIVLSASSSLAPELGDLVSPRYREYLQAEQHGRQGDCPKSFFSLINLVK